MRYREDEGGRARCGTAHDPPMAFYGNRRGLPSTAPDATAMGRPASHAARAQLAERELVTVQRMLAGDSNVDVLAILESGDFDRLVGLPEGATLEFKGEPCELSTEAAKFELAKDVAALASGSNGGTLIIRVTTGRPPDSPYDHATRVRPMPVERLSEKQYRGVIQRRVYPSVRGLAVRSHAVAGDATRCLFAIEVPAQREEDKPFLVLAPLAPDGTRAQGWLLGIPTRALDETQHIREAEIHELIVRGRNVAQQLEEIARLVATPPASPDRPSGEPGPAQPAESPRLTARGEEALNQLAAPESDKFGGAWRPPALYLAAMPRRGATMPTFLSEQGVREQLQQPPVTRHDG